MDSRQEETFRQVRVGTELGSTAGAAAGDVSAVDSVLCAAIVGPERRFESEAALDSSSTPCGDSGRDGT